VNRYTTPASTAPAEPFMVESRVPVGESRLTTHVFVPFLTAVITMAFIAADMLLFQWRPVAGVVGAIGLAVFVVRVILADGLLTRLETITGRELDGVPGIGKPSPLALLNPEQARRDVAKLASAAEPSDVPRMTAFVTRCFTMGTPEAKQGIRPNTKERDNYVECRDGLIALGLACWRNPANHDSGWDMVLDAETTLAIIEKHVG
jgi:hypothetical protein